MKRGNYLERNYKSSTIGGMTANQTATDCSAPSREVAFSILAEIENITNDGINLATRIADSLGGSSPQVGVNPKDSDGSVEQVG